MFGIDISHYNTVDVAKTAAEFVIVKTTEGTQPDPKFKANAAAVIKAGKLLGLYHFARPDLNSASKDAKAFLAAAKPYLGRALLALDWETGNLTNVAWAASWCAYVRAHSKAIPIIYMSATVTGKADWTTLAKTTPLWLAGYPKGTVQLGFENIDNTETIKHWAKPTIWQYTSHGIIDGYSAHLDLDVSSLTAAEWNKLAGKPAPKKTVTFAPVKWKAITPTDGRSGTTANAPVTHHRAAGEIITGADAGGGMIKTSHGTFYHMADFQRVFPAWMPKASKKWAQARSFSRDRLLPGVNYDGSCLMASRTTVAIASNSRYPTANASRATAVLHTSTPPAGLAVPVYCLDRNPDGHIYMWNGASKWAWSTGFNRSMKAMGRTWTSYKKHDSAAHDFTWGEKINGVAVVKQVTVHAAWTITKTYKSPKLVHVADATHYYTAPSTATKYRGKPRDRDYLLKVLAAGVDAHGTVWLMTNRNTFYMAKRTDWSA